MLRAVATAELARRGGCRRAAGAKAPERLDTARRLRHLSDGYEGRLDTRQHEQLQEWQAEQQAGENHKNDTHGLEMKALSNRRD